MTTVQAISDVLTQESAALPSLADLAAAAFLARYSNRTFEAYRHDLRTYFQWRPTPALRSSRPPEGHVIDPG